MFSSNFMIYLRSRSLWIGVFLLLLLFLGLAFSSFSLPLKPLLYALILVMIFFILLISLDYHRLQREREKILSYNVLTRELEESKDLLGKAYLEVLKEYRDLLQCKETQTKKKLHELEEYSVTWAHEIKTPIAALWLLFEEETLDRTSLKSQLFKIDDGVDMLLNYLRLASPSTDYVFREIGLDEILKKSIRKYAAHFIGNKIGLHYEEVNKRVLTDEKWFGFLFEQLLSNALKYTEEGQIDIYWEERSLILKDRGIGIPEEDLPRVFEMGYTGYNGRIHKKSTGVGLALCERIAKELSLEIKLDSKVGEGTKVQILFPPNQIKA